MVYEKLFQYLYRLVNKKKIRKYENYINSDT